MGRARIADFAQLRCRSLWSRCADLAEAGLIWVVLVCAVLLIAPTNVFPVTKVAVGVVELVGGFELIILGVIQFGVSAAWRVGLGLAFFGHGLTLSAHWLAPIL